MCSSDLRALVEERWDTFVVPGLGIRCVSTNPWVTGAETCELVMALDNVGDPRAVEVFGDMLHTRHLSGLYWTGYVFTDDVFWPHEQTTYTSAAVILAADALSRTTPASGIFRADALPGDLPPIGLECRCAEQPAEPQRVPTGSPASPAVRRSARMEP